MNALCFNQVNLSRHLITSISLNQLDEEDTNLIKIAENILQFNFYLLYDRSKWSIVYNDSFIDSKHISQDAVLSYSNCKRSIYAICKYLTSKYHQTLSFEVSQFIQRFHLFNTNLNDVNFVFKLMDDIKKRTYSKSIKDKIKNLNKITLLMSTLESNKSPIVRSIGKVAFDDLSISFSGNSLDSIFSILENKLNKLDKSAHDIVQSLVEKGEVINAICTICYENLCSSDNMFMKSDTLPTKEFENVYMHPCKNAFHKTCINTWYSISKCCPMCRRSSDAQEI